jgi:iron-sulfur cluster assembly protein
MLKITSTAIAEIRRIQVNLGKLAQPVSLTVKQGGCCGLYYGFEFSTEEQQIVWQEDGVKIAVATEHQAYLENLKIDYAEDLMGGGFRFDNPQARATCSCSQSFSGNC